MSYHAPDDEDTELAVEWLQERWRDPLHYKDRREYERAWRVIRRLEQNLAAVHPQAVKS